MAKPLEMTQEQRDELSRFAKRGWMHAEPDDPVRREAIAIGLRKRWLRRELDEITFTSKGRIALGLVD